MAMLKDDYKKEEKINGMIYSMPPSANYRHGMVNGNIYMMIANKLRGNVCRAFMENLDFKYHPDVNDDYVIPDIMIICDRKHLKGSSYSRYLLIIGLSILLLLSTACSAATDEPAGAISNLPQEQTGADMIVPPLTDSGLSKLAEDFTYSPELPEDSVPTDNCFGFPTGLVTDLKRRMHEGDADRCIDYLDKLNEGDFRIANQEFFSLIDWTDEMTSRMISRNEGDFACYRCDTDGDGTDELIAFEKDDHRGTLIYMLIKSENGYIYYSSNGIDNVRFFTLFQYDDSFYYAASTIADYTGTLELQIYMLNRNIFNLGNIADSIYFNRMFQISEPFLLYRNETHPAILPVQDYIEDVIYDAVYANRTRSAFQGDETECQGDETERQSIDWGRMYIMDVNNDGKDERFTKSPSESYVQEITWYDEDFTPCPAAAKVWKDEHYSLTDMWFKNLNGKMVTFTLYKENQSGQRYLLDARIQEKDKTTILTDYMVELEPTGIEIAEFGVHKDLSIYKPLEYQDPDLDSAFPFNIAEMAKVLLLKVQGPTVTIKNECKDIPDDFVDILSNILTDEAWDTTDSQPAIGSHEIGEDAFYRKYGKYLSNAQDTLDGGTQSVYQIKLGSKDYYLLLQYTNSDQVGFLYIYQETAGRLKHVSTYHLKSVYEKVIEHSGKLYIVGLGYLKYGDPRYLDSTFVHQLIPESEQASIIEVIPETFQWQKIYDNHALYQEAVTHYLEDIKTELMDLSYGSDIDYLYSGDETVKIDPDKLLRLGSVASKYPPFLRIDFNNDQKDEYIQKSKSYNSVYTGFYEFTEKGIKSLSYNEALEESWGRPIQLWFKEIDGKVFTFRLFFSEETYYEETYYILNVSLIEDTSITQVQTHIIVPKVNYIMHSTDYTCPRKGPSSAYASAWQKVYANLLGESSGKDFYLCDIDGSGTPELLIGLYPSAKYAEYDVYTYDNRRLDSLGTVSTVDSNGFWSDGKGGLLSYDYGAGEGETHRHFIDKGVLSYDGAIHGYYHDQEGNFTEWFRGTDGGKVIVTEGTKSEYEKIQKSEIELERYPITHDTITAVIYGGE